jgi:hypothetical protein
MLNTLLPFTPLTIVAVGSLLLAVMVMFSLPSMVTGPL